MTYPVQVTQQSYDHKGGTKSYHFTMIEAHDGKAVVVFRYGKKGQFGQIITATFDTAKAAWRHYEAKEQEKSGSRGGYQPIAAQTTKVANNSSELVSAVGMALFNKIGAKAVNHIDPTFDTSKMRQETDPVTLDEDGRPTGDTSRKADIRDLLAQQKAEEEAKAARAYDDNEEFGIF